MVKNIPQRQCLACREMKPKSTLLRVTKTSQGELEVDLLGKLPGRGAYLCKEMACLQKIQKTRGLERGLSTKIPVEIYQKLEKILQNQGEEGTQDE